MLSTLLSFFTFQQISITWANLRLKNCTRYESSFAIHMFTEINHQKKRLWMSCVRQYYANRISWPRISDIPSHLAVLRYPTYRKNNKTTRCIKIFLLKNPINFNQLSKKYYIIPLLLIGKFIFNHQFSIQILDLTVCNCFTFFNQKTSFNYLNAKLNYIKLVKNYLFD